MPARFGFPEQTLSWARPARIISALPLSRRLACWAGCDPSRRYSGIPPCTKRKGGQPREVDAVTSSAYSTSTVHLGAIDPNLVGEQDDGR